MKILWRALLLLAISCAAVTIPSSAQSGTPVQVATPFECPVTQPNGQMPPESGNAYGRGWGDYGNELLWTSLWMWGEGAIHVPNEAHLRPNGRVIELNWAWFRYVPGKLTIEGHHLDAPAEPMTASVPDGYGEAGVQVSGITFPSAGCWEITGRLGDDSLTFVIEVLYPDGFTPGRTT